MLKAELEAKAGLKAKLEAAEATARALKAEVDEKEIKLQHSEKMAADACKEKQAIEFTLSASNHNLRVRLACDEPAAVLI